MDQKYGKSKNADHKSNEKPNDKSISRRNKSKWAWEYWSEHPEPIFLLFAASLLIAPMADFMTKQLKVWSIGVGVLLIFAAIIIFICKSITEKMSREEHQADLAPKIVVTSDPRTVAGMTTLLVPGNDPDPPALAEEIKRLEGMPSLPREAFNEIKSKLTNPDALKVILGPSLGLTSEESQVVVSMANIDLLTIHRTSGGISMDAAIFGSDGNILAQIQKNEFFINEKNAFRISRPDPHTLIVYDLQAQEAINIRYLNPRSISIRGIFRMANRPPLIITDTDMRQGDNSFAGNIVIGTGGPDAMFGF